MCYFVVMFFFFKQKTAYEMRISDWSSDVCSSDLPEAERRQVTVLFADLAGYTRLSSEIDAEEVHALLGRFFDLADGIISDYGGTVDKHIGDCAMAVFGAPVAHGNDAERAVRRSEEHTSELQSLMRISYAVFCLKKKI